MNNKPLYGRKYLQHNQLKIDLEYIPTIRKQPDKIVQTGIFSLKGKY